MFFFAFDKFGGSGVFVEVKGRKRENGTIFVFEARGLGIFVPLYVYWGGVFSFWIMINRWLYYDMLTQR